MTERLTEEQVRHVAKLSRLALSDAEVHDFSAQLSRVLEYVSKLGELDLDAVEPMAHALDMTNSLRPDEPAPPLSVEQVLANAPEATPPFFKVPKVIGAEAGA
jgi:aspartyl-tRNA(Asn)/glutamyl-tRNA(Gln) amidotransferase subunit C